jgi:hypothetical protein
MPSLCLMALKGAPSCWQGLFDGEFAISFPFLFEQAHLLFLHHLYQVLGVFFPSVFYPKVVDNKKKVIGCHSCVHSPGVVLLWL